MSALGAAVPARTTDRVDALPAGRLVEIEATAPLPTPPEDTP